MISQRYLMLIERYIFDEVLLEYGQNECFGLIHQLAH